MFKCKYSIRAFLVLYTTEIQLIQNTFLLLLFTKFAFYAFVFHVVRLLFFMFVSVCCWLTVHYDKCCTENKSRGMFQSIS
jgi:hypothetical protein